VIHFTIYFLERWGAPRHAIEKRERFKAKISERLRSLVA